MNDNLKLHNIQQLEDLKTLNIKDLNQLFKIGTCPKIESLNGSAKGRVIKPVWFKRLNLWRGKVFNLSSTGELTGLNRLGIGQIETQRYQFNARTGKSLFSDQDVLIINHDLSANPNWVRRYHDEMVQIDTHIYLATSYYRVGKKLKFVSYFAFDFSKK
ncbi:hypothetical protein [Acinetobacter sp. ANC 5378]|uniref:hypothetical protein n=1 Tax=Acinetobacter sp. ANC 5378 TaxID=2731249 RepID=UPI00148FC2E2|nr:hypothetical protein [Acinetobacter sp. ANC 5378]NNG83327.1 hypothetical protein [Acinetobacter sp. ANC 5378]